MSVINPFDFFLEPYAEKLSPSPSTRPGSSTSSRPIWHAAAARRCCRSARLVDGHHSAPRASVDFLVALNQRAAGDIGY
jgi:hypothetical protein